MFKNRGRSVASEFDTSPMPQPQPRPSGKRRHRKWMWVLLSLVVLFVIISWAGTGMAPKHPAPPANAVVYSVTSDATTISATYATLKNGSVQEAQNNNATPPWTLAVPADKGWMHGYSLVAQMNPGGAGGDDGTTISCRITVNGKVLTENTSVGRFAVVTCSN